MPTTVRDVMTTDVVTVSETAPFKEVAGLMAAYRVGAIPVRNGADHVVGMVSETDLLLKQEFPQGDAGPLFESRHRRAERRKADGRLAGAIMTGPAITIGPDTPVAQAARIMHASNVKHLPVVDGDGKLVGIVSRGDLLRVFLRGDDAILAEVRELVAGQPGADPEQVTVEVTGGVVKLTGKVELASTARILAMLARELDGVVGVDEELGYATDDLYVPFPIL